MNAPQQRNRPRTGLTADSTSGRVLLALRAGRMTSSEIRERFPTGTDLSGLARRGLVRIASDGEKGSAYELTDAGRATCPLRNPLAAHVTEMPPGAAGGRVASPSPFRVDCAPIRALPRVAPAAAPLPINKPTGDSAMTTGITISNNTPIPSARDAITKAIAGIDKAHAITRDELIARVQTDIARNTLVNVIKKMGAEAQVLGAFGATASRRYFDIRALAAPAAVVQADAVVEVTAEKEKPAGDGKKPMEFVVDSDGALTIVDGDEHIVIGDRDVRRLVRFLAGAKAEAVWTNRL